MLWCHAISAGREQFCAYQIVPRRTLLSQREQASHLAWFLLCIEQRWQTRMYGDNIASDENFIIMYCESFFLSPSFHSSFFSRCTHIYIYISSLQNCSKCTFEGKVVRHVSFSTACDTRISHTTIERKTASVVLQTEQ